MADQPAHRMDPAEIIKMLEVVTTVDNEEGRQCLKMLKNTSGGAGEIRRAEAGKRRPKANTEGATSA